MSEKGEEEGKRERFIPYLTACLIKQLALTACAHALT